MNNQQVYGLMLDVQYIYIYIYMVPNHTKSTPQQILRIVGGVVVGSTSGEFSRCSGEFSRWNWRRDGLSWPRPRHQSCHQGPCIITGTLEAAAGPEGPCHLGLSQEGGLTDLLKAIEMVGTDHLSMNLLGINPHH